MSYYFGIASALSEYASTRIVQGSNSDPPSDWSDILYDYFRKNYQGTLPQKYRPETLELVFNEDNQPVNPDKSQYHVFIYRGEVMEDYEEGASRSESVEEYMIAMYVKSRDFHESFDQLHNIEQEVRRIFIHDYVSYDLAGIRKIDHYRGLGIQAPASENNLSPNHYMLLGSVKIYYKVQSLYSPTAEDGAYNGHRYYAGQWRKEADGRDRPSV